MSRIGVLALQGGFAPHCAALAELGHDPVEVRYVRQLADLSGLVLPGGESTTMLKLIDLEDFRPGLLAFAGQGRPLLATCAGLILAAKTVRDPAQESFGWLDIEVQRNGWGRQLDSFEATDDSGALPLLFIRAPRITSIGADVEVMASLDGEPVMVRQGAIVGASFHPELTQDRSVHRTVFGSPE